MEPVSVTIEPPDQPGGWLAGSEPSIGTWASTAATAASGVSAWMIRIDASGSPSERVKMQIGYGWTSMIWVVPVCCPLMSATSSVDRYGHSPSTGAGSAVDGGAVAVIVVPAMVEVTVAGGAVVVPTVLVTAADAARVLAESAAPEQPASSSMANSPSTMGSRRTVLIDLPFCTGSAATVAPDHPPGPRPQVDADSDAVP